MSFLFRNITKVPSAIDLIDYTLNKTNRKTGTIIHKHFAITRIRKFYIRKIQFTSDEFIEKLNQIISSFPVLENIHPFYSDLIGLLYDKDNYKIALGKLNSTKSVILKLENNYEKMVKFADSLYRCKCLKKAALGHMVTNVQKLKKELLYLEEVRQHLQRLPSIDPYSRTVVVAGFPNVGKSSFISAISNCKTDVQPYAFTTQSLFVGHYNYNGLKYQIIDTPGILDHSLAERSKIEMLSITALAHLKSMLLYFIDISETCGNSISDQIQLYQSLIPLLSSKAIVVLSKVDLVCNGFNNCNQLQKVEAINSFIASNEVLSQFLNEDSKTFIPVSTDELYNFDFTCAKAAETLLEDRTIGLTGIESVSHRINPVETENPCDKYPHSHLGTHALVGSDDPRDAYVTEHKYDVIPEFMNGKNVADFISVDQAQQKLESIEMPVRKAFDTLTIEERNLREEINNARILGNMLAIDSKRNKGKIKVSAEAKEHYKGLRLPIKTKTIPHHQKKVVSNTKKGSFSLGDIKHIYRGSLVKTRKGAK